MFRIREIKVVGIEEKYSLKVVRKSIFNENIFKLGGDRVWGFWDWDVFGLSSEYRLGW